MARRSDHSREELREMVLAAAEQIVVEQGYEGLSARKVATAIGYTVGTLYPVIENLDDLILHINARTLDRLHACMTVSQAQCGDASDCLLQLGQVYIRFADEEPHRRAMVFEHRFSEDQVVPAWFPATGLQSGCRRCRFGTGFNADPDHQLSQGFHHSLIVQCCCGKP